MTEKFDRVGFKVVNDENRFTVLFGVTRPKFGVRLVELFNRAVSKNPKWEPRCVSLGKQFVEIMPKGFSKMRRTCTARGEIRL